MGVAGSAPELGEVKGPGAVAVGFLHGDQDALLDLGVVVRVVDLQLDFQAVELLFCYEFGLPVDAYCIGYSGDEEYEAHVGIVGHIEVGLEQPVAGDVRDEETGLVQNFDEARLTALGRGVTGAVGAACGHHQEGRLADEFQLLIGEERLDLGCRLLLGKAKL